MIILEIIFWLLLFIIFYSYIGYGLVAAAWVAIRGTYQTQSSAEFEPTVTMVVAAYNEKDVIREKVENCRRVDYPKDKLNIMIVTDGSDDGTPDVLRGFEDVQLLHRPERGGKVGALNRGMQQVDTDIVVFSDANTMLNTDVVRNIVRHYQDDKVGAVSGEKRVQSLETTSGAGESLYWKYESTLKKLDSALYSIVGAAGEIFSIRAKLYEPLEPDTILDDFMISLRINLKGYRVVYEPEAYALETPSSSIAEEWKRKVRISAGGFQSIARLKTLLNPLKHGVLSFEYISHRVLRWAVDPFALVVLAPLNIILAIGLGGIYTLLLALQILFYLGAWAGWHYEKQGERVKLFYVPFYFSFMNAAALAGWRRYVKKQQSAIWERAGRA